MSSVNKELLENTIVVQFSVKPYIFGLEKLNSIIANFVTLKYKIDNAAVQSVAKSVEINQSSLESKQKTEHSEMRVLSAA